jgi:hypothetical protein
MRLLPGRGPSTRRDGRLIRHAFGRRPAGLIRRDCSVWHWPSAIRDGRWRGLRMRDQRRGSRQSRGWRRSVSLASTRIMPPIATAICGPLGCWLSIAFVRCTTAGSAIGSALLRQSPRCLSHARGAPGLRPMRAPACQLGSGGPPARGTHPYRDCADHSAPAVGDRGQRGGATTAARGRSCNSVGAAPSSRRSAPCGGATVLRAWLAMCFRSTTCRRHERTARPAAHAMACRDTDCHGRSFRA